MYKVMLLIDQFYLKVEKMLRYFTIIHLILRESLHQTNIT